jgi:hypothetical protein
MLKAISTEGLGRQLEYLQTTLKLQILKSVQHKLYSREDIAEMSGIHLNTIGRFLSGGNLSINTLIDLAHAVDTLEDKLRNDTYPPLTLDVAV